MKILKISKMNSDFCNLVGVVVCGNDQLLKTMLKEEKYKSLINEKLTETKQTLLHLAVIHNHLNVVKLLLEFEICCAEMDSSGNTPLHFAVINNRIDMCDLILSQCLFNQTEYDIANINNDTPLNIAVVQEHPHMEMIDLLLSCGSDPHDEFCLNDSSLYRACVMERKDIVKMILLYDRDLDRLNEGFYTHLHHVSKSKDIKNLLSKNIKLSQKSN